MQTTKVNFWNVAVDSRVVEEWVICTMHRQGSWLTPPLVHIAKDPLLSCRCSASSVQLTYYLNSNVGKFTFESMLPEQSSLYALWTTMHTKFLNPCHVEYIKMPHLLLIFSQPDYLIRIVAINSHTLWQTVQIQISWLLIWIYTICKGRVYPGSAGQGLIQAAKALV